MKRNRFHSNADSLTNTSGMKKKSCVTFVNRIDSIFVCHRLCFAINALSQVGNVTCTTNNSIHFLYKMFSFKMWKWISFLWSAFCRLKLLSEPPLCIPLNVPLILLFLFCCLLLFLNLDLIQRMTVVTTTVLHERGLLLFLAIFEPVHPSMCRSIAHQNKTNGKVQSCSVMSSSILNIHLGI